MMTLLFVSNLLTEPPHPGRSTVSGFVFHPIRLLLEQEINYRTTIIGKLYANCHLRGI